MTAVGVATLFITQDYTRTAEGLACKGNLNNPAIDSDPTIAPADRFPGSACSRRLPPSLIYRRRLSLA